jgi:hypothetical protein
MAASIAGASRCVMRVMPGASAMVEATCRWCEKPFRPRRGGSQQRFCGSKCRATFWSALRDWAERALAAGVLTVAEVRSGNPAACTLLGAAVSSPPVSPPPRHVRPGEVLGVADGAVEIGEDAPSEAQRWAERTQPFEVASAWLWSRRLALWQRWRRWAPQWGPRPDQDGCLAPDYLL